MATASVNPGQVDVIQAGTLEYSHEAPNDETMTRLSLGTAAMGYVRTETLRALSEADYRKIAASLP